MKKSKKTQTEQKEKELMEEIPVLNLDEIEITDEKKNEENGNDGDDNNISKDNPFMNDK